MLLMLSLMAVLPGPDFPSGGIVVDDGLADAYAHGRGTVRIRARAEVVQERWGLPATKWLRVFKPVVA